MMTVSLSDELESLKTNFPKIQITSATCHFVTFTYERTIYARVKATLTFPEDYPAHALLVSISLVPPGLQRKLERELGKVAQDLSPLPQVEAAVQHLLSFMDTNKFVPCWKELKQVVERVKADENSTIALNENKGLIQLRLTSGKYYYACSITVDENYPSTTTHETWGNACKLVMRETNFCPQISIMLTRQAKELVRHMQDGKSFEKALYYSNPIKAPNEEECKTEVVVVTSTKLGKAQVKPYNTKDGRYKNAKTEWKGKEHIRLESYELDDYADPQPSLLSLVIFLSSKIQLLPEEKCPICKELTLPSDPEEGMYTQEGNRKNRPIRTHCGCWYHYGCLNKFMVEPPFGAACPALHCGERVYHPDWPADRKELEQCWANKQARQREIEDAAMFL